MVLFLFFFQNQSEKMDECWLHKYYRNRLHSPASFLGNDEFIRQDNIK